MDAEAGDDLDVCFEDGNVESDKDNEKERESDSEGYVDVDEEDEGLPHEWNEDIFDYQRVQVSLEDVNSDLRKRLREAVERIMHCIESSKRSQTFAYDVNDVYVDCDELNNFSAFADTKFWCHLMEFLNKNRGLGVQAVDGRAMTKFSHSMTNFSRTIIKVSLAMTKFSCASTKSQSCNAAGYDLEEALLIRPSFRVFIPLGIE